MTPADRAPTDAPAHDPTHPCWRRNIRLYPWWRFAMSLVFWQGIWFLYFQSALSPAAAIALYAIYDMATTLLEAPLGYLSDRIGRRPTLILASFCGGASAGLLCLAEGFAGFAAAQMLMGASAALASGADSAFLFETLKRCRREAEIEAQELRAWRYGFSAMAASALIGGLIAMADPRLAFAATALSFAAALALAMGFTDPGTGLAAGRNASEKTTLETKLGASAMLAGFRAVAPPDRRVLAWLFALSVGMYAFSHVPFVFGQPFILEAVRSAGLSAEAPAISGAVSAAMMLVSVAVSLVALPLKRQIGLTAMLITAAALQVALIAALALTNHPAAILLLLSRMAPDALSRPFILARSHPVLPDAGRATYLSLQSLAGRLVFSMTLLAAAASAETAAALPYAEAQAVLAAYAVAGAAFLIGLALLADRSRLDR